MADSVTIFIQAVPDVETLVVRLPCPPGPGPKVDFSREIDPGGDFDGIPYEELRAMGPGRHDVPAARFAPQKE